MVQSQALVAGIAAEHDLPFLVISAGTRNHFALDLGLDRDNPAACLDALIDGVEQRTDLGIIGGRTFVNNASFGAYAEVVRSPAYRDDKRGTTLQVLPDLLTGRQGATLTAPAGAITGPQAVLVSNNAYDTSDVAGLGRRARLDAGALGHGRDDRRHRRGRLLPCDRYHLLPGGVGAVHRRAAAAPEPQQAPCPQPKPRR